MAPQLGQLALVDVCQRHIHRCVLLASLMFGAAATCTCITTSFRQELHQHSLQLHASRTSWPLADLSMQHSIASGARWAC